MPARAVRDLRAEVLLDPLGEGGDAAQRGPEVVGGRVGEAVEVGVAALEGADEGLAAPGLLRRARHRRLRLAVAQRVVHRGGRAQGELLRGREVGGPEDAARDVRHEGEGADDPVAHRQRHDHRRAHAQGAQHRDLLGVDGQGREHLVGHLRDQLRVPGAQHARDAVGLVGRQQVALVQPARDGLLRGVDVGHGDRAGGATVLREVHPAAVAEGRDQQPGDPVEGVLEVERRGDLSAGLAQDALPRLGAPLLGEVARVAREEGPLVAGHRRDRELDGKLLARGPHRGELEAATEHLRHAGRGEAREPASPTAGSGLSREWVGLIARPAQPTGRRPQKLWFSRPARRRGLKPTAPPVKPASGLTTGDDIEQAARRPSLHRAVGFSPRRRAGLENQSF